MPDFDASFVRIRQAQIATVVDVVGARGLAFEALFAALGPELAAHVSLASRAGFGCLRLSTIAQGDDAVRRLCDLYALQYGVSAEVVGQIRALCAHFGPGAFRVSVEEPVSPGPPRLDLSWQGDWSRDALLQLLRGVSVDAQTLARTQSVMAELGVQNATRFTLRLDSPDAAPKFELGWPQFFGERELGDFQGRIARAASRLGVSARQGEYVSDTVSAFAPREVNRVLVTAVVARDHLVCELGLAYPVVPAMLLLRVLSQFAAKEGNGLKLGTMTAAMGIEEEIVSEFVVTARDVEPPGLFFELTSTGMPGVGDA